MQCQMVSALNTFVTLAIRGQHYLDGTGFELLRVTSSTSPGQELFSVKELSPWLVTKRLQTSQTEKLLN